MNNEEKELAFIKDSIFNLICHLEPQLLDSLIQNKIDSNKISSLARLIDSFTKLHNSIPNKKEKKTKELLEEDINLLKLLSLSRDGLQKISET